MARQRTVTVTVHNWDKYNPRKDVKSPSWFRLDHSILEDPDFFDFSQAELLVWIYILCNASKKSSASVTINFAHAERVARLHPSEVLSAIKLLRENGNLEPEEVPQKDDVTDPLRGRDVDVTASPATNERDETNETRQDETRQDETLQASDRTRPHATAPERVHDTERDETPQLPKVPSFGPDDLFQLWNDGRGSLPEAGKFTEARRKKAKSQLRKYPDRQHWVDVLGKFLASEWLTTEWRPGIDVFLREDKRVMALEGAYDNRERSKPKTKEQAMMDHNKSQMERVWAGEL